MRGLALAIVLGLVAGVRLGSADERLTDEVEVRRLERFAREMRASLGTVAVETYIEALRMALQTWDGACLSPDGEALLSRVARDWNDTVAVKGLVRAIQNCFVDRSCPSRPLVRLGMPRNEPFCASKR